MENIYNTPNETPNTMGTMPRRTPPADENARKTTMWVVGTLILLVAAFFTARYFINNNAITSFNECVDAGNPVMESYPRQCSTPDGKTFVEDTAAQQGPVGYVSGTVRLQPICPQGQACTLPADAYTSRRITLYAADGATVVQTAALGPNGAYRITANPGQYWLELADADGGRSEKKSVTIVSGETFTVDFNIDIPLFAKG